MATEVLMPKLGLTMTEGTIEEWKIKEGQPVKKGDVLFTVATDKLTNDVEADADGVLLKVLLPEGETGACKSVIAYIGAEGETVPDIASAVEPCFHCRYRSCCGYRARCCSSCCCRSQDRAGGRRRPRRLCGRHPGRAAGRQGHPD